MLKPARRIRWYHVALPALAVALPVVLLRNCASPTALPVRLEAGQWIRDNGDYAGTDSCRECHRALVDTQLASNHAKTIRDIQATRPAAPMDTGQKVIDPVTGAQYSVSAPGGKPQIQVTVGSESVSQPLNYEFGSGLHAYGYMSRSPDGQWVDARLNYYLDKGEWGFTSTQEKAEKHLVSQPLGRPQSPATAAKCFTCHSTIVRASGVEKLTPDGSSLTVRPEKSVLNVTCEGCHGPQGEHVRLKRANTPPQREGPMSANDMNKMCGRCHGLDDVNPAHPVIARFQPWGLSRSRCFSESDGKLSCSTCHDPHDNARRDPKYYEAICLSCHTPKPDVKPAPTICKLGRKEGCVGCHMPLDSTSMPHVKFYDHRIRVVRDKDASPH